jgi:NAD(P)-dependent dehydrogenase (short-subunit alcohol dehydrogenase family)
MWSGLTKPAALEVANSGVRVNAVAPRLIESAMLNRLTGAPGKENPGLSRVYP